jgi:hypothetical protein
MPTRNIKLTDAVRILDEQDARLKTLRQAAKQGFDEIDQGNGILLKSKYAIRQLVSAIESEGATRAKR